MDDFEKGLVLLGLISPSNEAEVSEIAALKEFEKEASKQRQQLHFKRVVLAAEIVSKLHAEISFGKIKFQKLVYLCEHVADMNLSYRYSKQAAGPFDNKFMHSIHTEFKKLKWFGIEIVQNENYTQHRYLPLENANGYLNYYRSYFSDHNEGIQFIIDLFRTKSTNDTELAATVFACYQELSKKGDLTKESLFNLFYDWSERKKKFREEQIISSFNWLIENNLIPQTDL